MSVSKDPNANEATFTTSTIHGFSVGQIATIKNTLTYTDGTTATFSYSSGELEVTIADHGYSIGDFVTFEGAQPQELNGTFLITDVPTASTFKIKLTTTATNFSCDKIYKNKNVLNGDFLIKAVTADTFTISTLQTSNGSGDFSDNVVVPIDEFNVIKCGSTKYVSLLLQKQFNTLFNSEQVTIKGYRTEQVSIDDGLIPNDRYYQFYDSDVTTATIGT